jgi:hypothetical protein
MSRNGKLLQGEELNPCCACQNLALERRPVRKPRTLRPGRPSKLTPALQLVICNDLDAAVPEKAAAEANGVNESTFHEWMKKGAQGIKPYAGFHLAVTRARARGFIKLLVRALAGGPGSRAAMWVLERRRPQDFGKRSRAEHSWRSSALDSERRLDPAVRKLMDKAVAVAMASKARR